MVNGEEMSNYMLTVLLKYWGKLLEKQGCKLQGVRGGAGNSHKETRLGSRAGMVRRPLPPIPADCWPVGAHVHHCLGIQLVKTSRKSAFFKMSN